MSIVRELENLLRLIDDPSPVVQRELGRRFLELAPDLEDGIDELDDRPPRGVLEAIEGLLLPWRRERWRDEWSLWLSREFDEQTDLERLEAGLTLIARFLSGFSRSQPISDRLDLLAHAFERAHPGSDPLRLARFLFSDLGFRGPDDDSRDLPPAPRYSDLAYVMEERRGLSISLCCIFILVGGRLGFEVEGCNFPRHFLARVRRNDEVWLVDTFQEGRAIREREIVEQEPRSERAIRAFLRAETKAEAILARVLRNLRKSYAERGDDNTAACVDALGRDLARESENRRNAGPIDDHALSEGQPAYATGQLVRHRRYGYRGVVVDFDLSCRADEAWYRANRTRPERNQPWYRVLVHGSQAVTYAAQSSLRADESNERVEHPLVERFFSEFTNGRYVRNSERFPKPEA